MFRRHLHQSSTDQSIVDTDIPYRLAGLAFALIQLLSIIVLMTVVAWQVFFLFIIILVISIWYQASKSYLSVDLLTYRNSYITRRTKSLQLF